MKVSTKPEQDHKADDRKLWDLCVKNDGFHDLEYDFGDDEALNKRLSFILNADSPALRYKKIPVTSKGIPR